MTLAEPSWAGLESVSRAVPAAATVLSVEPMVRVPAYALLVAARVMSRWPAAPNWFG